MKHQQSCEYAACTKRHGPLGKKKKKKVLLKLKMNVHPFPCVPRVPGTSLQPISMRASV